MSKPRLLPYKDRHSMLHDLIFESVAAKVTSIHEAIQMVSVLCPTCPRLEKCKTQEGIATYTEDGEENNEVPLLNRFKVGVA